MLVASKSIRPELISLGSVAFLLFAAPRASLKVGSLPLYLIDILLIITLFYSMLGSRRGAKQSLMSALVITIASISVVSEFRGGIYLGNLIAPLYVTIRTLLAISLFFSVSRIVRSRKDVKFLLKCVALGMLVTVSLMIISSIPPMRGIARAVFSIRYLEPDYMSTLVRFGDTDAAIRGRSLVGVSILSGAFINAAWPLAILLQQQRSFKSSLKWKGILTTTCLIAPLGVLVSYSRGAILGMLMVVAGAVLMRSKSMQGSVIAGVIFLGVVVYTVGYKSDLFFFDRLEKRTAAMIVGSYEDKRETERSDAYTAPFIHLSNNPEFSFVGVGTTRNKVGGISAAAGVDGDEANHAVFAEAYYSYGLIAALLYMGLIFSSLNFLRPRVFADIPVSGYSKNLSQALLLSILALLPWFAFGHAAISQPRGAMLVFFILGFVASLPNLERSERSRIKKIKTLRKNKTDETNRRHSALG